MTDDHFSIPGEIWKDIPEFPGYQVSDHGRVRSFWYHRKHLISDIPQTILKSGSDSYGYPLLSLRKNKKNHYILIHRVVLSAFVCPRPPGLECRHLDGDATNNHLTNLCWGTQSENYHDRNVYGTWTPPVGENHYRAEFNESHIKAIRYLFSIGFKNSTLADMYKTTRTNICRIVYRRTWKHI